MIIAIVKAKIAPHKESELRKIANILQYDYAVNELGCHRYESFIDGDDFLTIEIWENQAVLDIHLAQDHVKKYVPEMRKCIVGAEFDVTFIKDDVLSEVKI